MVTRDLVLSSITTQQLCNISLWLLQPDHHVFFSFRSPPPALFFFGPSTPSGCLGDIPASVSSLGLRLVSGQLLLSSGNMIRAPQRRPPSASPPYLYAVCRCL